MTFANAVLRSLAGHAHPEIWPAGLLADRLLPRAATAAGSTGDPGERRLGRWPIRPGLPGRAASPALIDHGNPEYIVSCHLVKELCAVQAELAAKPNAPWAPTLLAAVRRFLDSPLKRKHSRRTAHQAIAFVALEG